MAKVDELNRLSELLENAEGTCGENLAPIPGESWTCVLPKAHYFGDHLAEDGTCW